MMIFEFEETPIAERTDEGGRLSAAPAATP